MSGVWWLNVMQFRRFAISIADAEKKNNKDSTETRKIIKDSKVILNLLTKQVIAQKVHLHKKQTV